MQLAAQARLLDEEKRPEKTEPFGLRAMWLHFANELEMRRLAKVHKRIEQKKRALADLTEERTKIMNRCIRRMRRAQGKN
ncbi:hypothetical protein [Leisingera caerulea]|uniref:hypothetical protein n=1 Tax=Leisingera caerulea TaxID=506591 RepID=UPI0012B5E468|nr:hypothetical protein [Leisingera caerulea]